MVPGMSGLLGNRAPRLKPGTLQANQEGLLSPFISKCVTQRDTWGQEEVALWLVSKMSLQRKVGSDSSGRG